RFAYRIHAVRLIAEFERTNPSCARVRNDLDPAITGPFKQSSAIAPQNDEWPFVTLLQAQLDHEFDHLAFSGGGVGEFAEQRTQLGELGKNRLALFPVLEVHGFRALKQILHIKGRKSHGSPRKAHFASTQVLEDRWRSDLREFGSRP